MWEDPIVEEIHKIREEHARKLNFDLQAIYNDVKAQEKKSERKIISLPIQTRHLGEVNSEV